MKTYTGDRTIDGIEVTVDGEPLDPRYDLATFSELGFEWTYEGGESRQLALALLADHLGEGARAVSLSDPFMRAVVANLDNTWEMTSEDIAAAIVVLEGLSS
jgi:hypothetical protein